ncbi:iron ABC transporter permease [Nocardioides sp. cx-169]|uniref:FecCD family ABC transporter permease n=1 Tax=Nocardioides sp. cx-169 TaxID=2899080 RepID=UPI001E3D516A|nr:iron ABC transporter permease [Nocardioides sp. cx-169]MCD4532820.1 iron ABC transporter permease [Nocardioides sp. cx-169]
MSAPTARPGVRIGPVGIVVRRRAVLAGLALGLSVVGLLLLSLLTGTIDVAPDRVWAALSGQGTRIEELVVLDRRFGRAVAAILIGFALGAAGGLTQSITRNPIASPDILGITAGAGAAATLLLTRPEIVANDSGLRAASILVPAAIVGGLVTTGLILLLGWRGGFSGMRLILVGIAVNSLAVAVTSWLITRSELESAAVATRWLVGSLEGARYDDLAVLLPVAVVGALATLVLTRDVSSLRLGRDVSSLLGSPTARTEAGALLVAVLLSAVTTAIAGPIGFVAFIAPQVALRVFRTAGPPPLAAGLVGAALLLGSDVVAQRLPAPLPVGIVTAVVGAPFLLYLVTRSTRRTSV